MSTRSVLKKWFKWLPLAISFLSLAGIVDEVGFTSPLWFSRVLGWLYILSLLTGLMALLFRYWFKATRPPKKVWWYDAVLLIIIISVALNFYSLVALPYFSPRRYLYMAVVLIFLREFSTLHLRFNQRFLNPARLFIASFLLLVLAGTFLLMLPNATHSGISFLNALFTSTSAVCVTGLIVVDTGTYFTPLGQTIIMVLFQMGGLGIMTFTSYFSYFFTGGASYENQLLLREMTNSEKLAEVFSTLRKILILTFSVEFVGVVLIYFSLDGSQIPDIGNRLFFSVFHSISGFCNAGFSTLTNSLYQTGFRFNYPLHLIVSGLFVLGGIGFPILFNLIRYSRYYLKRKLVGLFGKEEPQHQPWVININTRIVFITTAVLLLGGTLLFFVLEYNNTLAGHSLWGKVVTSFFGASTPRTAGFNTVDMSALQFTTIMVIILLMWVGASPGSTGGGIKTSTLAIATLNFFSHARGKNRIEAFKREISYRTVSRAFAIISLSLVAIGLAITIISATDSDKSLLSIAFECFSAYSTVGLSLGITSALSSAGKVVIIFTMFIGRVSMLTLLVAFLQKVNHLNYRYPSENILIN